MSATTPWLRPLGVGERIDASIKLYLRSFRTFAPAVLVVAVPLSVLFGLLGWWQTSVFPSNGSTFVTRNLNGSSTVHWGVLRDQLGVEGTTLLAGALLYVAARAVSYRLFADTYLGRRATWPSILSGGLRRFGSLLLVGVLIDGADLVVIACAGAVIAALVPLGPAAVLLMLPPAVLCFVFLVWWWVACRMTGPTVLMEDLRGIAAVRRSIELSRGYWWSLFGTALLAYLLTLIVTLVVNLVLRVLVDVAISTSDVGPHAFVLTFVQQLVNLIVVIPFFCAVGTVLAVDMRVRKEGLDLAMLTEGSDVDPQRYDFLPGARSHPVPGPVPGAAPGAWPPPPPPPTAPPADR